MKDRRPKMEIGLKNLFRRLSDRLTIQTNGTAQKLP